MIAERVKPVFFLCSISKHLIGSAISSFVQLNQSNVSEQSGCTGKALLVKIKMCSKPCAFRRPLSVHAVLRQKVEGNKKKIGMKFNDRWRTKRIHGATKSKFNSIFVWSRYNQNSITVGWQGLTTYKGGYTRKSICNIPDYRNHHPDDSIRGNTFKQIEFSYHNRVKRKFIFELKLITFNIIFVAGSLQY